MCYKIQVKYSILVNDVISKRAKDIVSAWHCCYRLSRLIVLCQFANWLWIRSRSGDHLSVSGPIVWTQPRKTWNKWTFLNGTHTENIQCQWSIEAWLVEITAAAQPTISYFVPCDISLSGHFALWEHDLIIEASPICNNLPAIVILKVSFLDWRINCGSVPRPSPLATFHCILSFLLFCETEAKLQIWPTLPDKGREAPQPT